MKIVFGLALDDPHLPPPPLTDGGVHFLGPNGLLRTLESYLGLAGHPSDNDYLRIEEYRQALRRYLEQRPDAFFTASFIADQFATATEMLSRRDELLLAGWDFHAGGAPPRLATLAAVEKNLRDHPDYRLSPGFADRFTAVLEVLDASPTLPFSEIGLVEQLDLLPAHFRSLMHLAAARGIIVRELPSPAPDGEGDLGRLQRHLLGQYTNTKIELQGDGSLLVLRGKRETDLAAFLAAILRRNAHWRPAILIPGKNRALDNALIQEGLPGLGIPSASLARPTLQVLKLVTVFLWYPVDPYKVMEFVSLAVKPLDEELANRIAALMAQTPGLNSESWYIMASRFFEELDQRAARHPDINPREVRRQYDFWFQRRRYDINGTVPKEEVIEIFAYLEHWALRSFEDDGTKNNSLLVLSQQARRIRELLQTLPEEDLTHLELERIVRTIYEPSPVQFIEREQGHLAYAFQPHALTGPVDQLLWWNFIQQEPDHFFSRWYQEERSHLAARDIYLQGPREENARLIWQRRRPLLLARSQLLLVIPEYVDGKPVLMHPLFGDLEARCQNLKAITLNIDTDRGRETYDRFFELPGRVEVLSRRLGRPNPFLQLDPAYRFDQRAEETFTSLQAFFYYPYQWVFRHKIKLRKSSILSIVPDNTLLGNLAHRFFEQMFKEDISGWNRNAVNRWVDAVADRLLQREGAVLLMYGREPERVSFIKKIKHAAWSLILLIQQNGWSVLATEKPLEGSFLGVPIAGRTDLVLHRGDELAIIDLKWRGAARRERSIRNEEDLQLVLYARLLTNDHTWAHTAYFIMENGKMIARNNLAFKDIIAVNPDSDHIEVNQRILQRMAATYRWRLEQVQAGRIEIRCSHTQAFLEEEYGEELMDLLEMKREDAPWDDYRTLIYLVD